MKWNLTNQHPGTSYSVTLATEFMQMPLGYPKNIIYQRLQTQIYRNRRKKARSEGSRLERVLARTRMLHVKGRAPRDLHP